MLFDQDPQPTRWWSGPRPQGQVSDGDSAKEKEYEGVEFLLGTVPGTVVPSKNSCCLDWLRQNSFLSSLAYPVP